MRLSALQKMGVVALAAWGDWGGTGEPNPRGGGTQRDGAVPRGCPGAEVGRAAPDLRPDAVVVDPHVGSAATGSLGTSFRRLRRRDEVGPCQRAARRHERVTRDIVPLRRCHPLRQDGPCRWRRVFSLEQLKTAGEENRMIASRLWPRLLYSLDHTSPLSFRSPVGGLLPSTHPGRPAEQLPRAIDDMAVRHRKGWATTSSAVSYTAPGSR